MIISIVLIRVNIVTQCQFHNMSLNWSILKGYQYLCKIWYDN